MEAEEAKTKELRPKYVKAMVCPECYNAMEFPSEIGKNTDRYQRQFRRYVGHCCTCDKGYEVVQVEKDGRWHLYKYLRANRNIGEDTHRFERDWQIVGTLPDPPAVVVGPGGDYDSQLGPDSQKAISACEMVVDLLEKCAISIKTIRQWIADSKYE